MQAIHPRDFVESPRHLSRWRAVVVSANESDAGLGALGLQVEPYAEVFTAFSDMLDDPSGLALFVLDCDCAGGFVAAQRLVRRLKGYLPRVAVVLLTKSCPTTLADQRDGPVVVNPTQGWSTVHSAVRHALRDRYRWQEA